MRKSVEEVFEDSKAALRLYYRSEKERFKLLLVRKLTEIITKAVRFIALIMLLIVALFFLFGAAAITWGNYLDNYALGSLYTGLCILGLIIIIVALTKSVIKNAIMRSLIIDIAEEEIEDEI